MLLLLSFLFSANLGGGGREVGLLPILAYTYMYMQAPHEMGTFFRLQLYERPRIIFLKYPPSPPVVFLHEKEKRKLCLNRDKPLKSAELELLHEWKHLLINQWS